MILHFLPRDFARYTKALEQSLQAQGGTVETVWHPGGHEIRSSEIDAVREFLSVYGE